MGLTRGEHATIAKALLSSYSADLGGAVEVQDLRVLFQLLVPVVFTAERPT